MNNPELLTVLRSASASLQSIAANLNQIFREAVKRKPRVLDEHDRVVDGDCFSPAEQNRILGRIQVLKELEILVRLSEAVNTDIDARWLANATYKNVVQRHGAFGCDLTSDEATRLEGLCQLEEWALAESK